MADGQGKGLRFANAIARGKRKARKGRLRETKGGIGEKPDAAKKEKSSDEAVLVRTLSADKWVLSITGEPRHIVQLLQDGAMYVS
jgi:hypothetical protein